MACVESLFFVASWRFSTRVGRVIERVLVLMPLPESTSGGRDDFASAECIVEDDLHPPSLSLDGLHAHRDVVGPLMHWQKLIVLVEELPDIPTGNCGNPPHCLVGVHLRGLEPLLTGYRKRLLNASLC